MLDAKYYVSEAKVKVLNSTPRKLGLVVALIRGKKVSDAIVSLKFCKKKAALAVCKVLNSALSNACHNKGADVDELYVGEVLVGKSMTLRRVHARAMGKACRIKKHYSNLTIKLFRGV